MTSRKKVGGLALLIGIPILILLFLQNFGQQHYIVPTDPAEAEGLSAEVPAGSLGKPFSPVTSLIDRQGNSVANDLLLGKQTIVFPLRKADTDTAQAVLEQLTRVQDVFEQQKDVQLLVVTSEAELARLSSLAERYRSQPGRWRFLADTTQKSPLVGLLPLGTSSSTVMLVDQDQRIRGYYDGIQEDEIDRLLVETRILRFGVE